MKVVICGDRHWVDEETIYNRISLLNKDTDLLITGGCKGADAMAEKVCGEIGFESLVILADWGKCGRSAGPIRNRKMLDEKPDLVIAFHSNIETSRGTKDCITAAAQRGINIEVIK